PPLSGGCILPLPVGEGRGEGTRTHFFKGKKMKELMVVAIGGNSIIKDNASQSIEHQSQAVKAVAESVLEMLASDYDIVLTHGNGPQVGLDLRRAEIAHEREGLPLSPLANFVADT